MEVPTVRVAVSYHHDEAEVARQLQRELITAPSAPFGWALLFATERYQAETLLEQLHRHFPGLPVFGGACLGLISHPSISFGGFGVQLVVFPAQVTPPTVLTAEQLSSDPYSAGLELASRWAGMDPAQNSGLLLYDSLGRRGRGRSQLNSAQWLLDGFNSRLAQAPFALAGGAMLGNEALNNSWLVAGDRIIEDAAMLLVMPAELQFSTALSHGNLPISRIFEVTASDNQWLLELDGEPALEVLCRTLQLDPNAYPGSTIAMLLSIGQRLAEPGCGDREHEFLSRNISTLDTARKAIRLVDAYLKPGDRIQFMCRDQQQINDSLSHQLAQLDSSAAFADSLLALYINCAGRSSLSASAEQEDAHQLRQRWRHLPLAGFYSAGEIAPVDGLARALDWTGVVCLLNWAGGRS